MIKRTSTTVNHRNYNCDYDKHNNKDNNKYNKYNNNKYN